MCMWFYSKYAEVLKGKDFPNFLKLCKNLPLIII